MPSGICRTCGNQIWKEKKYEYVEPVWVDNTGGDACGNVVHRDVSDPVQFTVTIDYVPDQGWEASAEMLDGEQFGWASSDPITLLAAIARDLDNEITD